MGRGRTWGTWAKLAIVAALAACARTPASRPDRQEALRRQSVDLLLHAESLGRQRQFSAAIVAAEQALRLGEVGWGQEHLELVGTLELLMELHRASGDLDRAAQAGERVMRIGELARGRADVGIGAKLGELYLTKGDHARAEPLLMGVMKFHDTTFGRSSPEFAAAVHNVGVLNLAKGNLELAESLLDYSLIIKRKKLGAEHPAVAEGQDVLASLYKAKGDFDRAELLYQDALRTRLRVLGADHPAVAISLSGLASLHHARGNHASAEELLLAVLRIDEQAHGPWHPTLARDRANLALVYQARGQADRAEALLQSALQVNERALGPENPGIAPVLNNLAALYSERGEHARAAPLLDRALHIRERGLGPQHPDVAVSLANLASLYEGRGEIPRAIETRARANDVLEHNLANTLVAGSEAQKLAYVAAFAPHTHATVSLHVRSAPGSPDAARLALTAVLRQKGRAIEAVREQFHALRQHGDTKVREEMDRLNRLRAERSARGLGMLGPTVSRSDPVLDAERTLTELARETETLLERMLAARFRALKLTPVPVTLAAVQAALPPGAVLVELFVHQPVEGRGNSALPRRRYVAYLLPSHGDPSWADLGEAELIDRLAREVRARFAAGDHAAGSSARQLDRLVMEPLRRLLGEATDVFLSPDGELNLVPFGALLDERGQYLVKRYRFTYLSSGRDLVRLARQVRGREGPTILAAPHYDDEGPPPAAQLRSRSPFALAGPSFNFSPLPGTQAEAAAVARTLGDARVLTGGQATEKALKTLRGPRLLHLATHGFFLADLPVPLPEGRQRGISRIAPTGGTPGKPDKAAGLAAAEPAPSPVAAAPGWAALADPLLRSGLALAGANRRASGDDDGILTALEAMALDLVGTQLVVLSACETGVGDVRHGDGVYGLRRALVLAGAETQLVTLWRIDDAATQRLIAEYYARIARGVGRSEAMREVSLQMLSNPRTSNPRLWAPFVVSGDPRPLHHHGAGNLQ